jgi:hypothetical protein
MGKLQMFSSLYFPQLLVRWDKVLLSYPGVLTKNNCTP